MARQPALTHLLTPAPCLHDRLAARLWSSCVRTSSRCLCTCQQIQSSGEQCMQLASMHQPTAAGIHAPTMGMRLPPMSQPCAIVGACMPSNAIHTSSIGRCGRMHKHARRCRASAFGEVPYGQQRRVAALSPGSRKHPPFPVPFSRS
eukprot:224970-Chlamydomonas_euryale.AAC.1